MEPNKNAMSSSEDFSFSSPLIVYRTNSHLAYEYAMKIVLDLLVNYNHVSKVFVEDHKTFTAESIRNGSKSNGFLLEQIDTSKISTFDLETSEVDICIILGGDGTTLWANRLFKINKRPPFLTFNMGNLGYMSIYHYTNYREILCELFGKQKGKIQVEKRSTLKVRVVDVEPDDTLKIDTSIDCDEKIDLQLTEKKVDYECLPLNDCILEKPQNCHMIYMKLYLNKEPLTIAKCDGLILSTSTGSTAYNLSAGGTLVHHDVDTYILNAICPFSLSFRSIALPRGVTMTIVPCFRSLNKIFLVSDGIDNIQIKENQIIEVSLSDIHLDLIILTQFVKNRTSLWKQKIVNQLSWNSSFKNY